MTYEARGNEVFYLGEQDREELFLTVYPTTGTKTPAEQAALLAELLNQLPIVMGRAIGSHVTWDKEGTRIVTPIRE